MKTCPSARPGSRKPKKGVQNAPKHESAISTKSTIRHFWSANLHFKSAELHSFGLWPNSLQVPIRHTLFDFFVERHVSIRILPVVAYFLSITISINRDWISKIQHILLRSRRDTFSHSQISHPSFLVLFL